MSMLINQFDPGYSVSVVALGGTPARWAFTRVPRVVELVVLDEAPAREDSVHIQLDDDCERWDGLS